MSSPQEIYRLPQPTYRVWTEADLQILEELSNPVAVTVSGVFENPHRQAATLDQQDQRQGLNLKRANAGQAESNIPAILSSKMQLVYSSTAGPDIRQHLQIT